MGAVEHLKTYCCLGLRPESAMLGIQSLLHEIVPHGWSHIFLCEPDATVGACFSDNPASTAIFQDRLWHFAEDPTAPLALWTPAFHAVGIGWTLHRQGRGWLDNGWYREMEAPLDSCWMLDAMIGDCGQTIAGFVLRRPRGAAPFMADDVERLDRLRPWIGHALRRQAPHVAGHEDESVIAAGEPLRSGEIIMTSDGRLVFQTEGLELLFRTLGGEPANYLHHRPRRDTVPAPIGALVKRISGISNSTFGDPPRMQCATPFGILTLEAKWLVPAGTRPEDVARDPSGCLVTVTIELREHAAAYAARMLRESGATPAQVTVGVKLALGKSKAAIAQELGLQTSSVADQTKKLYRRLDIHTSGELGLRLWTKTPYDSAADSHARVNDTGAAKKIVLAGGARSRSLRIEPDPFRESSNSDDPRSRFSNSRIAVDSRPR